MISEEGVKYEKFDRPTQDPLSSISLAKGVMDSHPDASNGRYIVVRGADAPGDDVPEEAIARYEFKVDPGTYRLHGRVWSPEEHGLRYRLDGGEWQSWRTTAGRGGEWREEGDFELDGGTHTIEITYRGPDVRMDKLLVESDGTVPIGAGHPVDDEFSD